MRIAVADNTGKKFCQDIIDHWEKKGHEVKYERGASEYLAQWADIYYVEWLEGNINYLWKLYNGVDGVSRTPDWDNNKKPKIVCRMIDWDVWNAYVPFYEQQYIDFIDQGICIAPHIEKYILEKAPSWKGKLKLIRPAVNLEKFTLKKKKTNGYQLGMVLGDMWMPKNHMGGLDIFNTLYKENPKWRLHIRGQHEGGTPYWEVMYNHYIESRGLRKVVTLYPPQDDMNTWYENIDVLLHPGMKEAFCYAVGEAMAKGITPVVNDFYGSRDIWPHDYLYQTHQEAIEMLHLPKEEPKKLRKYIEDNYSIERMMREYDNLLGL